MIPIFIAVLHINQIPDLFVSPSPDPAHAHDIFYGLERTVLGSIGNDFFCSGWPDARELLKFFCFCRIQVDRSGCFRRDPAPVFRWNGIGRRKKLKELINGVKENAWERGKASSWIFSCQYPGLSVDIQRISAIICSDAVALSRAHKPLFWL